jgi:hypothetical protein
MDVSPTSMEETALLQSLLAHANWSRHRITKIKLFAGRLVGDLQAHELGGARVWMDRVESGWAQVGIEIRTDYFALREAMRHLAEEQKQQE